MPLRVSDPESDDALETLLTAVSPSTDGSGQTFYGSGAFIWGSEPGKRTAARRMLSEMEDSYGNPTLLIDCEEHNTTTKIYKAILDEIVDEPSRDHSNLSHGSLLREIDNTLEKPCIVVFDRADQLEDKRVLHSAYEKEFIIPVIIARQRHELLSGLDERIVSRVDSLWPIRFEA